MRNTSWLRQALLRQSAEYSVYTFSGQVQAIYQLSVFSVKKNRQFSGGWAGEMVLVLAGYCRFLARSRAGKHAPHGHA
jgi:hypothetical protein